MKSEIENRFNGNLERVEHLVAHYETVSTGPGRRAVDTSDILRSAVVFCTRSGVETINQTIAPRSTPHGEGDLISGLCWRAQGIGSKEGITPRR